MGPFVWYYEKDHHFEITGKNFTVFFPKELDSIANYTISFLDNNINDIKIHPKDKIRRSNIINRVNFCIILLSIIIFYSRWID